jgi:ATP-dependent Lon protease
MVKKLNELECMLNLNLIKNEEEKVDESICDDNYNDHFLKYILKNLEEFNEFINEWEKFKIDKKIYIKEVDKILDKCTYGQSDAKDQMKRIIGQWMNGVTKGQCFGLCGPPGVGKTTLCKNGLAKCLFDENGDERPFAFLPLGGATNGSILEGHHYTYLGSTWGKIVDILMETKCMNPIIYIDELDKVSKTEHGKEITGILTHLIDSTQNDVFQDKYFSGIDIDLSKALFIFSYNDPDQIDRILLDRIHRIKFDNLTLDDKIVIVEKYILPDINKRMGFSN